LYSLRILPAPLELFKGGGLLFQMQGLANLVAQPNIRKVKVSRYRPGVAQRVGRGIALLFHDRGIRRW